MLKRTSQSKKGAVPWNPAQFEAIFYDFDGVMTDNRVTVFSDGTESVVCHRGDGWAVGRLKKLGVHQCIISTETNEVVRRRADKIGLPCLYGINDKKEALLDYAKQKGLNLKKTIYVGNDENDLPAMNLVGIRVAPSDASPGILKMADVITKAKGGHGVVRELLDFFERPVHK